MLGQCGPRVPCLKWLFSSSRYPDEVSNLQRDRQAELQFIWQEIGDDKYRKSEELQQLVSAAIHNIYERAMEENLRRKADLEDMVAKSETRLKELLGSNAIQVIASRELPFQARLDINMAQLEAVENSRFDAYGWGGGILVLAKLRHQIAALREVLKLPPCESADLDEVLSSMIKDLHNMCPRNSALASFVTLPKTRQKPIFQRMYQFHHTLCTIENVWVHSLTTKDEEKVHVHDILQFSRAPVQQCLQNELREMIALKNVAPNASLGCSTKRSRSKIRPNSRESRHAKVRADEALALEQLSNEILKKLEKIMKQAKSASQPHSRNFNPLLPCSRSMNSLSLMHMATVEDSMQKSVTVSPSSENDAMTPTSVLPESRTLTPMHGYNSKDQLETLDVCWEAEYVSDLHNCKFKEANAGNSSPASSEKPNRLSNLFSASNRPHCEEENQENVRSNRSSNLFSTSNKHDCHEDAQFISCPSTEGLPLTPITIIHTAPPALGKIIPALSNAPAHGCPHTLTISPPTPTPPLPPPPPARPLPPPPPPPPPPPSHLARLKTIQFSSSAKLRKSSTISRLYQEMKKKMEGAASMQSNSTDAAAQRRHSMGHGSREGMAEALAEITRRSSYFRKIEDDVHKHAKSILMVKSRLEAFETSDIHQLLDFHSDIEARLEHLTDESQVLARFQGFPIKKLETVRAAASLHLKLSSLLQQIENWRIEPPMSDQLEKINAFFEKVKIDVEAIERTRDEDCKRFSCQKLHFKFETITLIKEAIVSLSSRCLASTLVESETTKAGMKMDFEYLSMKDMTKLRGNFQMLYKAFQLAFRVHNFAGGHDDQAEHLSSKLALEMETYPCSFWLELIK